MSSHVVIESIKLITLAIRRGGGIETSDVVADFVPYIFVYFHIILEYK